MPTCGFCLTELPDLHVGDIGTELVVTVVDEDGTAVNVGSATKTIYLTKPAGSGRGDAAEVLTKTAVNDTDGSDGKMKYLTVAGDLDTAGTWKIQGKIVVSGNTWKTSVSTFEVADP